MKFLVMFRGCCESFRRAEFEALTRLVRGDEGGAVRVPAFEETPPLDKPPQVRLNGDVFRWVELWSVQEAADIAARSVLIRGIYLCWGHGAGYDECLRDALERDPDMEPLRTGSELTFKCVVEAFGRSYSLDQQLERIHVFSPLLLKLAAKVRMREPDHELWIMEDVFPSKGHQHVKPKVPEPPRQVFFGLKVGTGGQHYVSTFTLKSRRYLGTTSMDAELAFLMANQGLVSRGSLVMDPFVGTGSIIVSAAAFGARVIGSDIDISVLRGKGGIDVASNFEQYGLEAPLGIVRHGAVLTGHVAQPRVGETAV